MNWKKEIFTTSDGSTTFYLPEINEYYHSHHGAIQEAKHVFLKNGLNYLLPTKKDNYQLNVLEIGFGTGLNALLTLLENKPIQINYHSLEKFPLEKSEIEKLNFESLISTTNLLNELHQTKWEETNEIKTNFSLTKMQGDLTTFTFENDFYDLIYFDAFGPRVQGELWTTAVFVKMYSCLKKDGILVTYCAKGQVKRDLRSVGFEVETLEGPPGKREMIRAKKIQ